MVKRGDPLVDVKRSAAAGSVVMIGAGLAPGGPPGGGAQGPNPCHPKIKTSIWKHGVTPAPGAHQAMYKPTTQATGTRPRMGVG